MENSQWNIENKKHLETNLNQNLSQQNTSKSQRSFVKRHIWAPETKPNLLWAIPVTIHEDYHLHNGFKVQHHKKKLVIKNFKSFWKLICLKTWTVKACFALKSKLYVFLYSCSPSYPSCSWRTNYWSQKLLGLRPAQATARFCVSTTKNRYMTKIECSKGPNIK